MTLTERQHKAADRLWWAEQEILWQKSYESEESYRLSQYEENNKAAFTMTEGRVGMPIPLVPRGVFWSRGWRGCPVCGGDITNHDPAVYYAQVRGTTMRTGWSCTGEPGVWAT